MQAIANLSVNAKVAKAVAEEGGINILAVLARSMNRLVAEEAAGGLWNLSVGEEHKVKYISFHHLSSLGIRVKFVVVMTLKLLSGCHC